MYLKWSLMLCQPLITSMFDASGSYSVQVIAAQEVEKRKVRQQRVQSSKSEFESLRSQFSKEQSYAVQLACEKGASSWLCALPLQEHGFALHKSAFRDALDLRYGWFPIDLPTSCSCGKGLSVEHALSCSRGGFLTLRHNEIRDLTAVLLT